jgi:CTP synthase
MFIEKVSKVWILWLVDQNPPFLQMCRKYVFVTGGVMSGLGKGVTASALGRLLKCRGFEVTMQKFCPFLNIDSGMLNPYECGEIFLTDDGSETDVDHGHYERLIDESLTSDSSVTAGQIYESVISKERSGLFGGGTVQIIPHITNEIKSRIYQADGSNCVTIIEVGGTVGDIENQPFLEAIRQFKHDVGHSHVALIHLTFLPYLRAFQETKTKPTQQSVAALQAFGLWPDVIVCRSEHEIDQTAKDKIALFCNVPQQAVIVSPDLDFFYEVPLAMEQVGLAQVVCDCWGVSCPPPDLSEWWHIVDVLHRPVATVTIGVVGKYIRGGRAYVSVVEALKHGGIAHSSHVKIVWVDPMNSDVAMSLAGVDGIVVPQAFGDPGIGGILAAINFARTHMVPFLGIELGMQMAVVEFARNVIGWADANSTQFDKATEHPVVVLRESGMRMGACECAIERDTLTYRLYGTEVVSERQRHKYEMNGQYVQTLSDHGMKLAGTAREGRAVDIVELSEHPFFIGCQGHPEFKSRPNRPHPLHAGLIRAALDKRSATVDWWVRREVNLASAEDKLAAAIDQAVQIHSLQGGMQSHLSSE